MAQTSAQILIIQSLWRIEKILLSIYVIGIHSVNTQYSWVLILILFFVKIFKKGKRISKIKNYCSFPKVYLLEGNAQEKDNFNDR